MSSFLYTFLLTHLMSNIIMWHLHRVFVTTYILCSVPFYVPHVKVKIPQVYVILIRYVTKSQCIQLYDIYFRF